MHDADKVHDRVRAHQRRLHGSLVADVRLHGLDLSDDAHRPQEHRVVRPAHRDAHAAAAPRQRMDDMAPEEARSAEDRHRAAHRQRALHHLPVGTVHAHLASPFALSSGRRRPQAGRGGAARFPPLIAYAGGAAKGAERPILPRPAPPPGLPFPLTI